MSHVCWEGQHIVTGNDVTLARQLHLLPEVVQVLTSHGALSSGSAFEWEGYMSRATETLVP